MAAGYLVYGPPNEFPDPGIDLPYHSADDPHAAALLLRTTLLMQKNGVGNSTVNNAVMKRSWDYLEMMWRTSGEMAFTWSPYPDERVWYAYMHGEIIETLVQCVKLSAYLAAGIPITTVKQRLLQTTEWLKRFGVENHAQAVFDSLPYRGYDVLIAQPNRTENIEKVYARIFEEYDDKRAFPKRVDMGQVAFPTHKFSWLLAGRAQRNGFYEFLYYVRGRQKAFWIPTWSEDFVLLNDVAPDANTLSVSNVGTADYGVDPRNCHIAIIERRSSGLIFTYRQITSAVAVNENTETLTLDEPIFDGVLKSNVVMICFMYLGRLDSDMIEIRHQTSQVASAVTVMKAVWEIRHV